MYRFLLSRRWLGFFALCVVFAIGCGFLSLWQWHRREARLAANHVVLTNWDRPPQALTAVLPDPRATLATADTWVPVQASGRYLPEATTLIRNRPRDGVAGHFVVVPFLTDGQVLLVDRGWVPTGEHGSEPDAIPAPPAGTVTVTVRLRPPEPPAPAWQQNPPPGQAFRKRPADLASALAAESGGTFTADQVITGGYGQLAAEDPAPATSPLPLEKPAVDEGPHLSYALQWIAFAIMGFIGFVVVARRTAEDGPDDLPAEGEPAGQDTLHRPGRRHGRRRRPTDEEEEDLLLDNHP